MDKPWCQCVSLHVMHSDQRYIQSQSKALGGVETNRQIAAHAWASRDAYEMGFPIEYSQRSLYHRRKVPLMGVQSHQWVDAGVCIIVGSRLLMEVDF